MGDIDEAPAMPEVMGFQTAMAPTQMYSGRGKPMDANGIAWGPTTQIAVSRLLAFIASTQTRLRAAMGGTLTDNQKKFMAQYMTDDLKALDDLQARYMHLLQHHGFQGREASTTVGEIKKAMKTDISEITVIDAKDQDDDAPRWPAVSGCNGPMCCAKSP